MWTRAYGRLEPSPRAFITTSLRASHNKNSWLGALREDESRFINNQKYKTKMDILRLKFNEIPPSFEEIKNTNYGGNEKRRMHNARQIYERKCARAVQANS